MSFCFFFNDTATTEIYTLSLHDALPIYLFRFDDDLDGELVRNVQLIRLAAIFARSEEHTSELQSQSNLVCRLLLEKKKKEAGHRPLRRREVLDDLAELVDNEERQTIIVP